MIEITNDRTGDDTMPDQAAMDHLMGKGLADWTKKVAITDRSVGVIRPTLDLVRLFYGGCLQRGISSGNDRPPICNVCSL